MIPGWSSYIASYTIRVSLGRPQALQLADVLLQRPERNTAAPQVLIDGVGGQSIERYTERAIIEQPILARCRIRSAAPMA